MEVEKPADGPKKAENVEPQEREFKPKKAENVKDKESLPKKMNKNPWIFSTLLLGILCIILLVSVFSNNDPSITGKAVSGEIAADSVLEIANSQVPGGAELVSVDQKNGVHEVVLLMNGREVPVYVTIDGENLISDLTPIDFILETIEGQDPVQQAESEEVIKSDKPKVELFIMTHCPYGTQAEKGLIPTLEALGDAVDAEIRFVHYFMHDPEEVETPRQVCIREEQPDKFMSYLKCFLEEGDAERCFIEAGIDVNKMETCISSGKADEYYAFDSELSQQYGVSGSPTLIINGVKSSAGRDSASYLLGICSAFNDSPSECEQELSSISPAPGFGWEGSSAGSTASCE